MWGNIIQEILMNSFLGKLRREHKNRAPEVRPPAFIAVLGGFGLVLFGFFAFYMLHIDESLWLAAGFGGFALLGLCLFCTGILYRIRWDKRGFTRRNFLGFSRKYTWSDLRAFSEMNDSYRLYVRDGKIDVQKWEINAMLFLKICKREYSAAHHDHPLPYQPNVKKKTRK